MTGVILKIDDNIATVLTEDNRLIEINPLFLPLKFKTGDSVELEGEKLVLRA